MPGSEGLSRYRVTRLPDKMSIYKMFKLTYLVSTSFPQSSVQGCEAFFSLACPPVGPCCGSGVISGSGCKIWIRLRVRLCHLKKKIYNYVSYMLEVSHRNTLHDCKKYENMIKES